MSKRKVAGVSPLGKNRKKKNPPLLGGIQIEAEIRVSCPVEACYDYWRDFENLPNIMGHLESVEVMDDTHSHWMIDAPGDTTLEWDAEIIEDIPNELISWRSSENAQIDNAGSVHFTSDDDHETRVKVSLSYNPPLGPIGEALGQLFGESPDAELADDLKRFKEALESQSN